MYKKTQHLLPKCIPSNRRRRRRRRRRWGEKGSASVVTVKWPERKNIRLNHTKFWAFNLADKGVKKTGGGSVRR